MERVYFAAHRGLCLVSRHGLLQTGYEAKITGPDFKPRRELQLAGIPSRARISPDGRYGATTGFVTGHSYADDSFSTQTVLIDMARGKVVADLEKDFIVTRNGKRIKSVDFNFWGVTFARQPGRFYATLRTGETTYLIEGDLRTRRARVLHGKCRVSLALAGFHAPRIQEVARRQMAAARSQPGDHGGDAIGGGAAG